MKVPTQSTPSNNEFFFREQQNTPSKQVPSSLYDNSNTKFKDFSSQVAAKKSLASKNLRYLPEGIKLPFNIEVVKTLAKRFNLTNEDNNSETSSDDQTTSTSQENSEHPQDQTSTNKERTTQGHSSIEKNVFILPLTEKQAAETSPANYAAIRRQRRAATHKPSDVFTPVKIENKGWSPLAKLALTTAAVVKIAALSYLAYTYHSISNNIAISTSPQNVVNKNIKLIKDSPSAHNPDAATKNNQNSDISEEPTFEPPFKNQFSENIRSSIPAMVALGLATTVVIAVGGIFTYLRSKSQVGDPPQTKSKDIDKTITHTATIEENRKTTEEAAAEAKRQQELEIQRQQENEALEAQRKLEEAAAEAKRQQELEIQRQQEAEALEAQRKLEEAAAEAKRQQELEIQRQQEAEALEAQRKLEEAAAEAKRQQELEIQRQQEAEALEAQRKLEEAAAEAKRQQELEIQRQQEAEALEAQRKLEEAAAEAKRQQALEAAKKKQDIENTTPGSSKPQKTGEFEQNWVDTPVKANRGIKSDMSQSFKKFDLSREKRLMKEQKLKDIKKIKDQYETYFEIEPNEFPLTEFKNKINEMCQFLMDMIESVYPEIQDLIYPGFVQLRTLSSRGAMEFAIQCLSSKNKNSVKVTGVAFTEIINKYLSVRQRYEDLPQVTIDEDQKTEYENSLERYKNEILKQAITFAKECRDKKVNYANENIKALDEETFQEILNTLFDTDFASALELIDLFIDIRINEKMCSSTLENFHGLITEILEAYPEILECYECAYQERSNFNLKKIIPRFNLLIKIQNCLDDQSLDIPLAMRLLKKNLGKELLEIKDLKLIFPLILEKCPLSAMTLVKECLNLYYNEKNKNNGVLKQHCKTLISLGLVAIKRKSGSKLELNKNTAANFDPQEYANLFLTKKPNPSPVKPAQSPMKKQETRAITTDSPLVVPSDFDFMKTKETNEKLAWSSVQQLVQQNDVKNKEVLAALGQLYQGKSNIPALHFHIGYLLKTTSTESSFEELKKSIDLFQLFEHLHETTNFKQVDHCFSAIITYINDFSDKSIALAMVEQACINNGKDEFLAKFKETYSSETNKSKALSVS